MSNYNERLDEILDNFLDGTDARLTEIGWERYAENVAEAKAAIRTLVLEEIIGEDLDDIKGAGGSRIVSQRIRDNNYLRAEQRKKLGGTSPTKGEIK